MSVKVQMMKWCPKETPVWTGEPEEDQAQRNQMVVDDVAVAVKKQALLPPVKIRHAGVEERGDLRLVEVHCCAGFEEVVEVVGLKWCYL